MNHLMERVTRLDDKTKEAIGHLFASVITPPSSEMFKVQMDRRVMVYMPFDDLWEAIWKCALEIKDL